MLFVLVKLLFGSGIQWLFGVLTYFYPNDVLVRFVFVVLVSVHGITILVTTLMLEIMRKKIANLFLRVALRVVAFF